MTITTVICVTKLQIPSQNNFRSVLTSYKKQLLPTII